jgi:hypothetical protein
VEEAEGVRLMFGSRKTPKPAVVWTVKRYHNGFMIYDNDGWSEAYCLTLEEAVDKIKVAAKRHEERKTLKLLNSGSGLNFDRDGNRIN